MEPDTKYPYIAAEEDTGPLVKALVQEPAGKNLIAYREWLTIREIASIFTKATGVNAEVVTLPRGAFPPTMPADLKVTFEENMAYWNEFGYEGRDDPTVIHPRDVSLPHLIVSHRAATYISVVEIAPFSRHCRKLLQDVRLVEAVELLKTSILIAKRGVAGCGAHS